MLLSLYITRYLYCNNQWINLNKNKSYKVSILLIEQFLWTLSDVLFDYIPEVFFPQCKENHRRYFALYFILELSH